ncbi:MAG: ribose 5-phosphate isomerase B [Deltaproteobacteria bacterium]|nr:ribose 5-phosphate isomerase B [Deltaproteobacteria bacterium]MBT6435093.1 ribose 5-phosphate isomerase B [Deltaproteobacteria bacterium]MBT6492673.1 ribose 5-phosphate isomerase B [Deltaproteobacteria bacterium]
MKVKITIGADHGGYLLKNLIVDHLKTNGHEVQDCGTHTSDSVDYPNFAKEVTSSITSETAELGILVCGSGIGMSMAANKVNGIRAALCFNAYMGRMTRAHNNANVLCLGERVLGSGTALDIVDAFVNTQFEGGRHQRRVDLVTELES